MRFVSQTQSFYTQESYESGAFLGCITESFIYSLLHPEERHERQFEPWEFSHSAGPPPDSRELRRLMSQGFKEANEGNKSRFPVVMYPLNYLPVLNEICRARQENS